MSKANVGAWWSKFTYNFGWANYTSFLGSRFANLSLLIPIFGYLVIFNDQILADVGFSELAETGKSSVFLNSDHRSRYVYFGLISIGAANLTYIWRRPRAFGQAASLSEYISYGKRNFVLRDYTEIYERTTGGSGPTLYGQDHLDQWHFFELGLTDLSTSELNAPPDTHFTQTLEKYEGLVRSLLIDEYGRQSRLRRKSLIVALLLGIGGYLLLLLPSMDLFLSVLLLTTGFR